MVWIWIPLTVSVWILGPQLVALFWTLSLVGKPRVIEISKRTNSSSCQLEMSASWPSPSHNQSPQAPATAKAIMNSSTLLHPWSTAPAQTVRHNKSVHHWVACFGHFITMMRQQLMMLILIAIFKFYPLWKFLFMSTCVYVCRVPCWGQKRGFDLDALDLEF